MVTSSGRAAAEATGNSSTSEGLRTRSRCHGAGARTGSRRAVKVLALDHAGRSRCWRWPPAQAGQQLRPRATAQARVTAPTVKGFAPGRGVTVQALALDHAGRSRRWRWPPAQAGQQRRPRAAVPTVKGFAPGRGGRSNATNAARWDGSKGIPTAPVSASIHQRPAKCASMPGQ